MKRSYSVETRTGILIILLTFLITSCTTQATTKYWGQIEVPEDNKMRYITGSEPESLDPSYVTGQPEARILIGLYDRLVEYHPKTMAPIPGLATHWEANEAGNVYTFHLRQNGKFSNGDPIKAQDFVWSFQRALSPELASRYGFLGYDIKYAEAYNAGKSFVKKDGGYVLVGETDGQYGIGDGVVASNEQAGNQPEVEKAANEPAETEFEKFITSPEREAVPSDPFALARFLEGEQELKRYFDYEPGDLSDPVGFATRVNGAADALSQFVKQKISNDSLSACTRAESCSEQAKAILVRDINRLIENEQLYETERFQSLQLSDASEKFVTDFNEANEKIAEDNDRIDAEIAALKDQKEKEEKAKSKKKPLGKLFFMNRFLFGEYFKSGLQELPLEPVEAKHLGVEAPDDYTVRITLKQSAPYFVGLLTHQFFAVVHRPTILKHGKDWIKPENIVTSGSYRLKEWKPYDEMTIEKDPNNWDAENVKLQEITFYPMDEQTTMMNIYKAGRVDALYNHTVPAAWNEYIRQFKDEYQLHPEMSIEYYTFSVKKPPVDKVEVRKAFSLAVDRYALEKFRKTVKRLGNFTPEGIFPDYEKVRQRVFKELIAKEGISEQTWNERYFDPKRACDLMKEAGYTVRPTEGGKCKVTDFPANQMTISYNTAESNKAVAEFVQAQWRQNLGIEVQIKNMEWKTYLDYRSKVEYTGAARAGWVGDYMDPFTFLSQFYTPQNDSSTGWWKEEYDELLEKANNTADPEARFELLARAEFMMLKEQPVIPLATQGTSWMKKPYVKGMYPNPGTMHPWKFVYIEEDQSRWDSDVDKIMTEYTDPLVEAQIAALMKTQLDFEASRKQKENRTQAEE
ncbi:MAG: hypothetical protein IPM63_18590 [Acidobacteriota bacterium]|nr:MAG: hypothetical protein IPM63_18590 [Acidobacteriota bacterium]